MLLFIFVYFFFRFSAHFYGICAAKRTLYGWMVRIAHRTNGSILCICNLQLEILNEVESRHPRIKGSYSLTFSESHMEGFKGDMEKDLRKKNVVFEEPL